MRYDRKAADDLKQGRKERRTPILSGSVPGEQPTAADRSRGSGRRMQSTDRAVSQTMRARWAVPVIRLSSSSTSKWSMEKSVNAGFDVSPATISPPR